MRRPLRVASLLAVAAAAGAAWFLLAPLQLGGSTSYAVIYGSSMEPHLHRGDLVILRSRPSYRRGEVVGYHSHELHRNVLHRIVAVHGNRFVFKGDNNGFLDPEQPAASQLFGQEWVVVPGAGGVLEQLRSPRNAAVVAGLAVLLLVGGFPAAGVRRRRRTGGRQEATPAASAPARAPLPPPQRERTKSLAVTVGIGLAVTGAAALAFGTVLGVLALRQPTARTVAEPNLYVQRGGFALSAQAPVGAVYQTPALAANDPVFLRLVHRVGVRFTYRVRSSYPSRFSGSARLDAVVSDGSGWRRRLVLTGPRAFHGDGIVLVGSLDLRKLSAAVRSFEAQTGEHNAAYRVTLVPRVRLRGFAGGRPIRDAFSPAVAFELDQLRLQRARAADGGPAGGLTRSRAASTTKTVPATLHLAGRPVSVASARRLALGVTGGGLALVLAGGALFLRRRRDDEVAAIERRFGDLVVDVSPGARARVPERRVATIDALARIAVRYERVILHEARADGHSFFVEDGGLVYRYDVGLPTDDPTEELDPGATSLPRAVRLHLADR